jgi:hypothetical protein
MAHAGVGGPASVVLLLVEEPRAGKERIGDEIHPCRGSPKLVKGYFAQGDTFRGLKQEQGQRRSTVCPV